MRFQHADGAQEFFAHEVIFDTSISPWSTQLTRSLEETTVIVEIVLYLFAASGLPFASLGVWS